MHPSKLGFLYQCQSTHPAEAVKLASCGSSAEGGWELLLCGKEAEWRRTGGVGGRRTKGSTCRVIEALRRSTGPGQNSGRYQPPTRYEAEGPNKILRVSGIF
jgi:hypothetical protein